MQFAGDGFQPSSHINNHFDISLRTQYIDFVPMELLQKLKWKCNVHDLQVKHVRDRQRSDKGQTLVTIIFA